MFHFLQIHWFLLNLKYLKCHFDLKYRIDLKNLQYLLYLKFLKYLKFH